MVLERHDNLNSGFVNTLRTRIDAHAHTHTHTHTHIHSLSLSLSRFTSLSRRCASDPHAIRTSRLSYVLVPPHADDLADDTRSRRARVSTLTYVHACIRACVHALPFLPSATEKLHTAPLHGRPWGQRPLSAWYRRVGSPRLASLARSLARSLIATARATPARAEKIHETLSTSLTVN